MSVDLKPAVGAGRRHAMSVEEIRKFVVRRR
jgi:hypothetical protein